VTTTNTDQLEGLGNYKFGWADSDVAGAAAKRGLSEDVVRDISAKKNEPEWMLAMRLKGLKLFTKKPMPTWGGDLSGIDFDNIKYFVRSSEKQAQSWDDLPADIKNTYDKLGIPEAEKQRLVAGVAAQYESEVVYHSIRQDLEEKGVLFLDTDTALREQPEMFREYFGSVIPVGDNKFAALNTAVWSGGSFIYVPPGVKVDIPLQAYFRINTENMGQFERTLIIADEGSSVHYVEGCTAPIYSSDSLHSAVVEIIVKKDAHVRYTTIQNWSNNVYNLVTKRTAVHEGGRMEWVDGNIGCLIEGSTITTPAGVKPIEQVVPGEQVLSYDEQTGELVFRRVLAKRYSGEQPVREVRTGDRRLRATDNHPFFSRSTTDTNAFGYVRADELSEAIVPIQSIAFGSPYKVLLDPDAALIESTDAVLRQIGEALGTGEPSELLTINGFDQDAGDFSLPDWVISLPMSQREALLGGWTATSNGGQAISGLSTLATSLGLDLGDVNVVDIPELPETVEIHKVEVSEHLETARTWDIEVEGTGNFVSEGFIVHNSKLTMKYPACYLLGERASGETLSVAFAGAGQHQDAGAKMVHAAPFTTSNIVSKSVARGGGRTSYRGLVQVQEGAHGSKANVKCDALLVDTISRSDTYPYVDVREDDVSMGHEATVSKVGEDQLFYLMSRGLAEDEAMAMVVRGFVEPIARELPMEYALELNRLIELQMEGSVG
jgi:Fe-S cluster assembly scaffold protein SufB